MSWTKHSIAASVLRSMEDYKRQMGERAAAIREGKGWSQEDLAHKAGMSARTVSRFENGHHDSRGSTVRKLAKALGVKEDDIRGEPPTPLGLGHTSVSPEVLQPELAQIDERLGHIEQMLSQLLAREQATDQEASLQRAVAMLAQGVREEFLPKDSPTAPRKKPAVRRAS